MEAYSIVVFFIYIGLLIYIIPSSGGGLDLFERKFRLFPHWGKIVACCLMLLSAVMFLFFRNVTANPMDLLLANINLSLFLFFFSKQKSEDEFSEKIRFKAFTYSFVSVVAMVGGLGASHAIDTGDRSWNNFLIQLFLFGGLLGATLYFYFTLYKFRKEDN